MDCLKKLKKQTKKKMVNVLVFRITNNYHYLNAKPCQSCYKSILTLLERKNFILKNIYYTDQNNLYTL
jgi:hypothetical protein